MSTKNLSFEQAMQELEKIVSQMEQGDISLEESLKSFERGVTLARHSQSLLSEAEQKVKVLTQRGNTEELQDFNTTD
ncbi:exodeoxyribonuclease VII small subunit [Agaribacter marinus]|uniref:Exodeoxyribonuclease 7 small subunit n=1 Tax=Agaribacter marinus TaxID=1431249 RepID=A0AA37WMP4_9ALTE|nr:exodeoxyribonuclease VII small subunit [Agaribacter marinus]GLR73070.1 exodeoxyribonuclease 7 small subunit [Agaribacter marinus]